MIFKLLLILFLLFLESCANNFIDSKFIGINIGIEYSSVAVINNKKPFLIPNERGHTIKPSYLEKKDQKIE